MKALFTQLQHEEDRREEAAEVETAELGFVADKDDPEEAPTEAGF